MLSDTLSDLDAGTIFLMADGNNTILSLFWHFQLARVEELKRSFKCFCTSIDKIFIIPLSVKDVHGILNSVNYVKLQKVRI